MLIAPSSRDCSHCCSRGDHLVVWRLDRLERKLFRLAALIQELIDRGVILHVLDAMGGQRLDFDNIV